MPVQNDLYMANLAFLLNYDQGETTPEIEYEIFKIAMQDKESIHYDRQQGGNFRDIEQEPANITVGMWFTSNLIESIYYLNQEKQNNPYIIVGYNDITIDSEDIEDGEYVVTVNYRLLSDITRTGEVKI